MRCLSFSFAFLFIFSFKSFSQGSLKNKLEFDSLKTIQPNLVEKLQFKNFFRNDVRKQIGNNLLLGLTLNSKIVYDTEALLPNYNYNLIDYSDEELASFKESFNLLMEFAKQARNKYDLGEVGKYLGMSRKLLAIILAIVSLAK
jgi:hypothetical protein